MSKTYSILVAQRCQYCNELPKIYRTPCINSDYELSMECPNCEEMTPLRVVASDYGDDDE